MNTEPSSPKPLRARMIVDMKARGLGPTTQRGHQRACERFATWLGRSPDTATPDDVRHFQHHLAEIGISVGKLNQIMAAVKFRSESCSLVDGHRQNLVGPRPEPDRLPLNTWRTTDGLIVRFVRVDVVGTDGRIIRKGHLGHEAMCLSDRRSWIASCPIDRQAHSAGCNRGRHLRKYHIAGSHFGRSGRR